MHSAFSAPLAGAAIFREQRFTAALRGFTRFELHLESFCNEHLEQRLIGNVSLVREKLEAVLLNGSPSETNFVAAGLTDVVRYNNTQIYGWCALADDR